jgi:large subunit ribosomal protein L30
MAEKTQVKVTLVRSLHGQLANIAASARGLGLRKIRQTVTVADTPENRGMINTAVHLLKVEWGAQPGAHSPGRDA